MGPRPATPMAATDPDLVRFQIRRAVCERYAWSVPDDATLDWIATWVGSAGIVEVGAGSGYWAHLLADCGVDVVAFDSTPPGSDRSNRWHPDARTWTAVQQVDATVAASHASRTLLVAWPPLESGAIGLDGYRSAGGQQLIYMGEPERGACGDEVFWSEINSHWQLVEQHLLPQWDLIHDSIHLYGTVDRPYGR